MEPFSKARVKLIQSLHHKKFRLKYDKFIVEGLKIIGELAQTRPQMIEEILISNPDFHSFFEGSQVQDRICSITPQEMHHISQMTTPPGIMALCQLPHNMISDTDITHGHWFYLDAIRDPGNMGTIIRTADWFGFAGVILSPDCVDVYNHKVLQSSMGSVFRMTIGEMEKNELMMQSNIDLYVCDADGTSISTMPAPDKGIIILGNESLGVSDDFMHQVKEIIAIPRHSASGTESLNVASAAAIVAYWVMGKGEVW